MFKMRTKVDKDHKKAAVEKLKINLSSPKVVLNANDCAKLLDGMGKTSVIVVEKEGKMVAALPSSSSTSASSVEIKSNLVTAVAQSKLSVSSGSVYSAEKITNAELKVNSALNNNTSFHDTRSDHIPLEPPAKVIPKPPKKRRDDDRKLYEQTAVSTAHINGHVSSICPLRDNKPGGHLVQNEIVSSTNSTAPSKLDSSCKHNVENILQRQPNSVANHNSSNIGNHVISGSHTHHSLDSNHQLPPREASYQTTTSSLHCSSSSLSSQFIIKDGNLDNSPYHLTAPRSSPTVPTALLGPNSFLTHCSDQPMEVLAKDSESLSKSGHMTNSNSLVTGRDFQPIPEQEEPMNLSTSHQQVASLASSQSLPNHKHIENTGVQEISMSKKSEPQSLSDSSALSLFAPESKISSKQSNEKKVKKKRVKTLRPDHEQVGSCNNVPVSADFVSVHESYNALAESNERTECLTASPSEISEKSGQDKLPTISSSKVPLKVNTHLSKRKVEPLPTSLNPLLSVVSTHPKVTDHEEHMHSPESLSLSDSPSKQKATEDDADDICSQQAVQCNDSENLSEESVMKITESSEVPKTKKSLKKRLEIPMDEFSCADRTAQYLKTIDCVIEHFVYVPEPLDDIFLTEEEEAAMKNLFEDAPSQNSNNNTISLPDRNCVQKSSNKATPESNHPHASSSNRGGKLSVKSNCLSEVSMKPPKKRPPPVATDTGKAILISSTPKAYSNIDSVLAFVAADVTNSTPPVESGLHEIENVQPLKASPMGADSQTTSNITSVKKKGVEKKKCINITHSAVTSVEKDEKEAGCQTDIDTNVDILSEVACCKTTKLKKRKKKKSVPDSTFVVDDDADVQTVKASASETCSNIDSKLRKKKQSDKPKVNIKKQIKKKEVSAEKTVKSECETVVTKVSENAGVDTSDIGESISSTSGGSEQDTPAHDPETKDEMTITDDTHMADKENHDTGMESGGEDNKPVRRYKKRLDFVKCSQCEHQARGRSALSRHMKKVHMMDVSMPYKCPHCDYGCTKMASLNRHLFTHGVFPCSRCNFLTNERAKLTEHVVESHKDKLDMKLCKVCNRYIKCDGITIEQHTEACQGPTPYKCSHCEKEFKYASSLRVHYHTHFPDEPKRFKCELCEYKTNYKANLHKHHKNMHASRDKDIRCPDCGKLFSTEDNMRRHRKVHTLVRPFACETCKKTFKTSGALKGHQLIHTATRPFACNIPGCNRSFRTPKFLKSHQEEFHRLVPKKFFCIVEGCNFSFFKRSHLKRHAITHTGERNYHCTWPGCSKSFRHADNLKVHFRSHTNEKPVQCHLCDFKCKQRNSLFWHKKKVHQIVDAAGVPKREDISKSNAAMNEEQAGKTAPEARGEATLTDNILSAPVAHSNVLSCTEDPGYQTSEGPDTTTENQGTVSGENLKEDSEPQSGNEQPAVVEQSKCASVEQGPLDLYEFKSEDESEEETPGNFRRDKNVCNVLTPLPPPPKELLRKNEMQEQKEREKKEKEEKREHEKKEKVDKKEQEKRDRVEKKEQERKEREEKREQEKKEKVEKKEQEKKEKEVMKEKERQEKAEMKEREKQEKAEAREKERLEKVAVKEKEREEKAAKKEKEKKPKLEKKNNIKRKGCTSRSDTSTARADSPVQKSNKRKKSPARSIRNDPNPVKLQRGKRKKKDEESSKEAVSDKQDEPPSKRKKVLRKKSSLSDTAATPVSSPRGAAKTSGAKKVVAGKMKKRSPPKRKPSARIKANKRAMAKKKKGPLNSKKAQKSVPVSKKLSRSKAVVQPEGIEEREEDKIVKTKVEAKKSSRRRSGEVVPEVIKTPVEKLELKQKAEEQSPRAPSPEYTEENMLQGNASPYRDFSDADNLDEEIVETSEKYPQAGNCADYEGHTQCEASTAEERAEDKTEDVQREENCQEQGVANDALPSAAEESDDEVSNDIPLTPPRAPAPPPVESSEDEMEQEIEPAPFSVPGPNTPFSVPGPHTPFSVPPPTNLMQQSSVHSEETTMSAIPSVPSMDNLQSTGSVEMQQSHGSVETPHHGSVEYPHHGSVELSHGSVELPHHGSVEHSHHGSVEHPHHGSVEHPHHGSVELPHHGSVEHSHHGSVEHSHHGSVEHPHHGSVEHPHHGSVEHPHHGSVELPHHGSVEHSHHGSVEHPHHGSVEHPHHGSVEHPHHGSVEYPHHGSVEHPHHGSVEHPHHGSVEHPHHGSVELPCHGSVEHPHHGSVEHPNHGSVEHPHHGPVELPLHGSVEHSHHGSAEHPLRGPVEHPRGPVEMSHTHTHGSVELHSHNSVEMHPHGTVEIRSHGSVEMKQPHGSVEMQHPHSSMPKPLSQSEQRMVEERTTESIMRDNGTSISNSKYDLPHPLPESFQTSEADKEYFDQYLKSLSAANNRASNGGLGPSPSGLQQLEAMVDKSHHEAREMTKSLISSLPAIASLESTLPVLPPGGRVDALVGTERHLESFYPRDTASALSRLSERQTPTPLAPNVSTPTPAFDAFPTLNSLHPAASGGRDSTYLRQPDNLFPSTPVTNSFMAEAMFPRQAMATPFLPPQPSDRSSLSRIPEATPLRSSSSSSLLRRPTTMPGSEMFTAPTMPQTMPRHPFSNAWTSQEMRPNHWQSPYLPRQPNMAAASNPFFPSKENYLGSREFMFDPSSVRPSTERGMFPCLPSTQAQDSFPLERFDLSNYFPNAMSPYGSSTSSLDYTRSAHSAAPKPFDERYRQTAAAASAAIPDFRGLPPTTASTDMFPSIGLYASNPYHTQHMSDNVNSAFLTHSSSAQHAMFERGYATAAAHRGLYPHQNTPYPFIDERQYSGASKLAHTHPTPTAGSQERDLMSRSAVPDSQMQDPYRSMLYRY